MIKNKFLGYFLIRFLYYIMKLILFYDEFQHL